MEVGQDIACVHLPKTGADQNRGESETIPGKVECHWWAVVELREEDKEKNVKSEIWYAGWCVMVKAHRRYHHVLIKDCVSSF